MPIHGARYGEGYDPSRTFFDVRIRDDAFRPIATARAACSEFAQHVFGWVEVPPAGRDALSLLLVPRGYRFRILESAVEVVPLVP